MMKIQTRSSHYYLHISARQRYQQCQRRSRIAFRWALSTLLMTLVLAAALVNSGRISIIDWKTIDRSRSLQRHERLSPIYRSENRHRLEISVWDYEDIQHYYQHDDYTEEEGQVEKNSDLRLIDWSERQIEEMEECYRRYLKIFLKAHGDRYEPESKETVYMEYLAYRARTQKEKTEEEAAASSKMIQSEQLPNENLKRYPIEEEQKDDSNTKHCSIAEPSTLSHLTGFSRSDESNYNTNPVISSSRRSNKNNTERTHEGPALTAL